MTTMVELTGVGVDVGDGIPVLDGLDLTIMSGETLAVVGPNGAGKSTLLSVLAADVRPTRGSAELFGLPATRYRHAELARLRAVMLQDHHISFPFQVEDVIRMGRAPWRGRAEEAQDDAVVASAVDTAALGHLTTRRFPSLSGGERARTSFARVLAQTPRLLLLDEPTAALDIRHQERVLAMTRRHAAEGGAAVVVLHDLALASAYADRVLLLHLGHVAALGDPEAVLTAALLSSVYEHPVDVIPNPTGRGILVVPVRSAHDRKAPLR